MQSIILTICIALLFQFNALGQRSLTKDQIYEYWNAPGETEQRYSKKRIYNEDSLTNSILIKFVDSLKITGVDSIIIFTTGYPGSVLDRTCVSGYIPYDIFIFWNKSGEVFSQSFNSNCRLSYKRVKAQLFDLHKTISQNEFRETFMPVILSGYQQIDGNIFYEMSMISHEPFYTFYYSVGNDSHSYHFSESDIEDQKSLFHWHNLSLSAYKWWDVVKRQIDSENK